MYTPADKGGLGLSRLDTSIILEELAAGCTSTAAYISIHNMATWMVASWGSPDLLEDWQASLSSGVKLASYCLTEPNAGSDAANLRTAARLIDGQYIIDGNKMFISGAGQTDLLVVMARTGGPGPEGISAFAVPANSDGISFGANEKKMGWNSQPTRAVNFDAVKIPASYRLGEEGEGFKIAMQGLDGGRVNIATCSIGAARACLAIAKNYVTERSQFGRAIADFQTVQFRLADMATELSAARLMVHSAADSLDKKSPDKTMRCAMAKRFATDFGFNICNQALQLHGGYGYLQDYQVERYVRDSRVHQILEGTNEIMRVIIARRLMQSNAWEDFL
jgi:alkylation response protein AidB-like acyl-CoA dehydrogenase